MTITMSTMSTIKHMGARLGWSGAGLWMVSALLVGCGTPPRSERLTQANAAYEHGQYREAYNAAARLASSSSSQGREAAFIAGLAAQKLGEPRQAERYLHYAAQSHDEGLAADAQASLGLLLHARGQYAQAAQALENAARHLTGEQRANAYFYAGVAQQKLDRTSQARTNFILARAATHDANMRQRIQQRLAVTGYTIQLGAFTQRSNAERNAREVAERARTLGLGTPRLVTDVNARGQRLTIVQVGRFSSFTTAQQARQRLHAPQSMVMPIASK